MVFAPSDPLITSPSQKRPRESPRDVTIIAPSVDFPDIQSNKKQTQASVPTKSPSATPPASCNLHPSPGMPQQDYGLAESLPVPATSKAASSPTALPMAPSSPSTSNGATALPGTSTPRPTDATTAAFSLSSPAATLSLLGPAPTGNPSKSSKLSKFRGLAPTLKRIQSLSDSPVTSSPQSHSLDTQSDPSPSNAVDLSPQPPRPPCPLFSPDPLQVTPTAPVSSSMDEMLDRFMDRLDSRMESRLFGRLDAITATLRHEQIEFQNRILSHPALQSNPQPLLLASSTPLHPSVPSTPSPPLLLTSQPLLSSPGYPLLTVGPPSPQLTDEARPSTLSPMEMDTPPSPSSLIPAPAATLPPNPESKTMRNRANRERRRLHLSASLDSLSLGSTAASTEASLAPNNERSPPSDPRQAPRTSLSSSLLPRFPLEAALSRRTAGPPPSGPEAAYLANIIAVDRNDPAARLRAIFHPPDSILMPPPASLIPTFSPPVDPPVHHLFRLSAPHLPATLTNARRRLQGMWAEVILQTTLLHNGSSLNPVGIFPIHPSRDVEVLIPASCAASFCAAMAQYIVRPSSYTLTSDDLPRRLEIYLSRTSKDFRRAAWTGLSLPLIAQLLTQAASTPDQDRFLPTIAWDRSHVRLIPNPPIPDHLPVPDPLLVNPPSIPPLHPSTN